MTTLTAPAEKSPPAYGLVLTITTVLTLVLGWLLWVQDVKDRVYPRNFSVVEPGALYRSGRLSEAQAEPTLRDNRIAVVVSLINDGDQPDSARPMKEAIEKLKIQRSIFSMSGDGISTPQKYADAIEAIATAHKAGKPVLVHCMAGAQRTGGVIAVYELLIRKSSPDFAMKELLAHGHDPSDNPRLLPFLNESMPLIAAELVRRGVLTEVPSPLPVLKP